MNWLKTLFAENPWPLIWVLALAALGLVIAMIATGRGKYLLGVWVLAGLAVVLLALEWFWQTDRERVDQIIVDLAAAVQLEDANEIAKHLAPNGHYGSLDREGIRRLAESTFRNFDIDKLTINGKKTEVSTLRKQATSEFLAVVRGKQSNIEFNPYPTRWILTFDQSKSGDWLVVDIQQIPAFGESRQPIGPPDRSSLP